MNDDEFERIWKEPVVGLSRLLPLNIPAGTEENHENPQSV
jgi:hypothetical protein